MIILTLFLTVRVRSQNSSLLFWKAGSTLPGPASVNWWQLVKLHSYVQLTDWVPCFQGPSSLPHYFLLHNTYLQCFTQSFLFFCSLWTDHHNLPFFYFFPDALNPKHSSQFLTFLTVSHCSIAYSLHHSLFRVFQLLDIITFSTIQFFIL